MKFIRIHIILFTFCMGSLDAEWAQVGDTIIGGLYSDEYGAAVDINDAGDIIAIGSPEALGILEGGDYSSGSSDAGFVEVFQNSGGIWTKLGNRILGEGINDWAGYGVSLSSDGLTVAVGSPTHSNRGSARVFRYTDGSWLQLGAELLGHASIGGFGLSVSLSSDGSRVTVSEPRMMFDRVKIFEYVDGSWDQLGLSIEAEYAETRNGESVVLSADGSIVAISAPHNSGPNGIESGHVRVFQLVSGEWQQMGSEMNGEAEYDHFGSSISLSDDGMTIVAGAPDNDQNGSVSGHVRVYKFVAGDWQQYGPDLYGEGYYDFFGCSVSMSGDGDLLAIGSYTSPGDAIGNTKVLKLIAGSWTLVGRKLEGGASDYFGNAVSLNEDGSRVIIGAPKGPDGNRVGYVQVFDMDLSDTDGDGSPDADDAFPSDINEYLDTDGDGIGNNEDTDDDGDGYADAFEILVQSKPLDSADRQATNDLLSGYDLPYVNDQKTASRTVGQQDVTNAPSDYNLFTSIDVVSAEVAARSVGQQDVVGSPASYGLFTQSDVSSAEATSRTAGQIDVTGDPSSFDLFTQSEVDSAESAARTAGRNDVTSEPSSYSLFTAGNVATAEAASRTFGQADVTGDPSSYDLFTQAQLDSLAESTTQAIILNPSSAGLFAQTDLDATATATSAAIVLDPSSVGLFAQTDLDAASTAASAAIVLDPSSVGLFSQINLDAATAATATATTNAIVLDPSTVGLFASQEAIYFSFGQNLIELDKDSLTLDWSLMRTENLSVWEEIGKVEIAVPKQEAPYFFRFELNQ